MIYIYNPNRAPIIYGTYRFLPENYDVVPKEAAEELKQADTGLIFEDSPSFPQLWGHKAN